MTNGQQPQPTFYNYIVIATDAAGEHAVSWHMDESAALETFNRHMNSGYWIAVDMFSRTQRGRVKYWNKP